MQAFIKTILGILIWSCCCNGANDLDISMSMAIVYKCCESDHLLDDRFECRHVNESQSQEWKPLFYDEHDRPNTSVNGYRVVTGLPDCGSHQPLPVYEYQSGSDRLFLRTDGVLRHYTHYQDPHDDLDYDHSEPTQLLVESNYYDHLPGSYCIDKALVPGAEAQTAVVCIPNVTSTWDSEMLVKKVLDPLLHVMCIACLLTVAVVYFVLPALRDLVGNIISTIAMCLLVSQVADLVRIFTELSSHVSFIIADVIMYLSLLAAFFWLNSLGYYLWRSFRSRNIFLRVSDGRKYCYYSTYAWGATLVMTLMALMAHFLFDKESGFPVSPHDQHTIGWLGIAVFFTPIACTILVDLFFYLTTARTISRMSIHGHIRGRMKFSFELYIQLFLVMSTSWLFLLLSWLQYDALIYANVIVNALQAPLILIICFLGRKNIRILIRKTCCQGDSDVVWGEEMMSMTSN